ncbi:uncharacterized protein TRIVIDRAFT_133697, partial [Trichoderma virens Gv29-8]
IQFKQVEMCASSSTARSFAGYIHLPSNSLRKVGLDQSKPINIFFWFIESQDAPEKAPLTLYLNGGPGVTSSLLRETGPCQVKANGRSTRTNPWSWNRVSNMLYIDQPVNTGFSYDIAANATVDFRGNATLLAFPAAGTSVAHDSTGRLMQVGTVGIGTMETDTAVNTTEAAVRAVWLSLSIWLQDFPEFRSPSNEVELWTASYGGHFAPALYDFTMAQNALGVSGPRISFRTIGLMNACVDALVQLPAYPEMAYNNTYGLQLINKSTYMATKSSWDEPLGCKSRIQACRKALGSSPYLGDNASINTLCHDANTFCGKNVANLIGASGASFFDIGHRTHYLTDPGLYTYIGYLKQGHVQAALGVPVNFTDEAIQVAKAFSRTGDNLHRYYLESLGRALDNGVHITLAYGDRDYACNWLGGEALSRSIPHKNIQAFQDAGYQAVCFPPMDTNERDRGGNGIASAYVRQHGNLSFTRVLDSSHTINTDWPSVGFTLFNRTLTGTDTATGLIPLRHQEEEKSIYSTQGPTSTWHIKNRLPIDSKEEQGMCYVLALSFCSDRQLNAYLSGRGTVRDYWLLDFGDG